MDESTVRVSQETFDRLVKEYQICHEQAGRLESYIWQTAILFSVGSAIGLVSLASKEPNWVITVVAAIFAINVSLVWWRFARRWWSIQHLKFERMDEIDRRIGFRQSLLVKERDEEAQRHRRYMQEHGHVLQRVLNRLNYRSLGETKSVESKRDGIKNYEYRGNQPVGKLLVCTNIVLWFAFTLYTVSKDLILNFVQSNLLPVVQINLLQLTLVLGLFVFLAIVDLHFWRQR